MATIYDSIKNLISTEMKSKAAETLGEAEPKIATAVSILTPALLARMLKLGDTKHIDEIVQESGKMKLLSKAASIFEGHGVIDGKDMGERMENALIGSDGSSFIGEVAAHSGIAHESADRLSNWVSAVLAGFAGEKVVADKQTYKGFLGQLEGEKDALKAHIPANVLSTLGLGSLLGAAHTQHHTAKTTAAPKCAAGVPPSAPRKKSLNWLWWLLGLLLLLLICVFAWRACNRDKVTEKVARVEVTEVAPAPAVDKTDKGKIELTLPDGEKIIAYKQGCEDRIISFLNSDKYKNASEADLKKIWFDFDTLDFKHDSASEFEPGSRPQLDNLVRILKQFPQAKVMIGGFADKTGPQWANDEISKERAQYIKLQMEKAGIAASRISTAGFGETYATIPESATDSQRATDRNIALRFTK